LVWKTHEYDKIAGTYVFDGQRAHGSYALNRLFYSFNEDICRKAFDANPENYCKNFGLDQKQTEMVVKQDFLGILRAGANIYYMAKFCIPRGLSIQDAGAAFQGISSEDFKGKLLKKRIGLEDRLEKEGGYWNG